jgi:subtilisin-like proprotein convertase family protein
MLKYLLSFSLVLMAWGLALSQVNNHFQQKKSVNNIDKIVLPVFNNSQLRTAERQRHENEGGPLGFAQSHKTNISPLTHGRWITEPDGKISWSLIIKSPNAYTLNLGFTKFYLPESAKLYISSIDKKSEFGPFTADDNDEHGEFWTPLIDGDEIILKISLLPEFQKDLILELKYINHDYIGFGKARLSGSCNLDVNCGAADGWPEVDMYRDIIRSVGAYYFQSVNGTAFCSGVLINNLQEDCTPYFLTAFHCGVNQNNAASFVFVWNYENSICRQPNSSQSGQAGDGQKSQFNSGAILRANFEPSDVSLLEMDDPVNPDYNPFFAGWNASSSLPGSTLCIHHPRVEEKRISFDYDEPAVDQEEQDSTHVRVFDWDIGTTEGGSSGSPLFNMRKQIIGQLHGGNAACGNDEADSYGWFYSSWEGGGTSSTRLKDWLDPEDSGIMQLDGRNCGFGVTLSESSTELCAESNPTLSFTLIPNDFVEETIHLNIISFPNGANINTDKDSLLTGELATITLTDLDLVSSGIYNIAIQLSSESNNSIVYYNLKLTNKVSTPPIAVEPGQNELGVHFLPYFSWDSPDGIHWDFELAADQNFQNIEMQATNLSSSFYSSAQNLELSSEYFWRVRASNGCGVGEWSEIFSFTTGNIRCVNLYATDLPIEISEVTDTIQSTMFIHNGGSIKDVNVVDVSGDHSWSEDLKFTLVGPQEQKIILLSEECGSNNDFNFSIDDESSLSRVSCPLSQGFSYTPINPLSEFDDTNPRGHWSLEVIDLANFDGGELQNWGLELCIDISNDFSIAFYPTEIGSCGNNELEAEIFVGAGFVGPVDFSVINDPDGIAEFSVNPANPGDLITMRFSGLTALASGLYTVSYRASDGVNTTEENITISIDNGPGDITLISPLNLATNVDIEPLFSWDPISDVPQYTFELALDEAFINIVESVNVSETSYTSSYDIEELSTYYWRVSTMNECGINYSPVFSFETEMSSSFVELSGTQINIFPNPTSEFLRLNLDASYPKDIHLQLITVEGKVIQQELLLKGVLFYEINISTITPGIYFLQLTTKEALTVERIIIY